MFGAIFIKDKQFHTETAHKTEIAIKLSSIGDDIVAIARTLLGGGITEAILTTIKEIGRLMQAELGRNVKLIDECNTEVSTGCCIKIPSRDTFIVYMVKNQASNPELQTEDLNLTFLSCAFKLLENGKISQRFREVVRKIEMIKKKIIDYRVPANRKAQIMLEGRFPLEEQWKNESAGAKR